MERGKAALQARWVLAALLLVAVAAVALASSGCGGSSGTSAVATQGATPRPGGTLVVSYQGGPTSLDPAIDWEVSGWIVEECIFESLLQYEPQPGVAGAKLIPCLATEVPTTANGGISADGRTYTFHLRHGVKFQPPVSREVTAQDFKYSIERGLDPKTRPVSPGQSFYLGIEGARAFNNGKASEVSGIQAVDNYTLQITLTKPDLAFLNAVTMEFTDVVAKEWVEKWGRQVNRHPLGTGPFVFDHWTSGQEIVLKKYPDYWDAAHIWLDGVKFVLSYAPQTALLKLQRGEVDVLGDNLPPADVVRLQNDPGWSKYVHSQPQLATIYLYQDVLVKPFDNQTVRQAISWAINRDKLVKLLSGQATALYQVYPPGMPGYQKDQKWYGYDPGKAKQLLAQAGFPNGFTTTLYTDNVDPDPKLTQSVQNDLAAVGVKASIRSMASDTYYTFESIPGKASIGIFGWYQDFPDPSDWIGPMFIKASAVEGGMNCSFWWNPRLEVMYAQAQAMTDPSARIRKFEEMQALIMEEAPWVTLYSPLQTTMCSKSVGGFYLHSVYLLDIPSYWKE